MRTTVARFTGSRPPPSVIRKVCSYAILVLLLEKDRNKNSRDALLLHVVYSVEKSRDLEIDLYDRELGSTKAATAARELA